MTYLIDLIAEAREPWKSRHNGHALDYYEPFSDPVREIMVSTATATRVHLLIAEDVEEDLPGWERLPGTGTPGTALERDVIVRDATSVAEVLEILDELLVDQGTRRSARAQQRLNAAEASAAAQVATLRAERDAAVLADLGDGVTAARIARDIGLSHTAVTKIRDARTTDHTG